MKSIPVPPNATDLNDLLAQARTEDVLVQAADGAEFIVSLVDDFDVEVARTRQNQAIMSLLDERAQSQKRMSLDEVKRELNLSE
jgi:hypothetical protein